MPKTGAGYWHCGDNVCDVRTKNQAAFRQHRFIEHQLEVWLGDKSIVTFRRPDAKSPFQCTNASCGISIPLYTEGVALTAASLQLHKCHTNARAAKNELAAATAQMKQREQESQDLEDHLDRRAAERALAKTRRRETEANKRRFEDIDKNIIGEHFHHCYHSASTVAP